MNEAPRVQRIGLIGDVHTESVRLQGVLQHFAGMQLDRILCTGDVPDGPYGAREVESCVALLQAHDVLTIAGNHERWIQDAEMRDLPNATDRDELSAETIAFFAALPATIELQSPSGAVLLCHGIGENDMVGVQPHDHGLALDENEPLQRLLQMNRYRFVLSGHTHRAMHRTVGNLTLINAGTLLTGQTPCCSVVDLSTDSVQVYEVAENGRVRATGA